MNNISRKHHYLPRYYLIGFANKDNSFFVYDKREDRIFPSSPEDSFFENNLNTTILLDGSSSDFIEELYTDLENRCWKSLDAIRNSSPTNKVKYWDSLHLFLFLQFLYWRLPRNIGIASELSERAFYQEKGFNYLRIVDKTGENAPEEFIESIRQLPAFKKHFRQVVPWFPFFNDKEWAIKITNWRYFFSSSSWDIVGDNPVLMNQSLNTNLVNLFDEFVFPVSGNVLLVNVKNMQKKELPPELTIQLDLTILDQCERFIACKNKEFLEVLVKLFKSDQMHKNLINETSLLFDALK